MAIDIETSYKELLKKLKLPDFKILDDEFEISSLESEKFLLRNILRKIEEKLESSVTFIGSIVQPDGTTLSGMHETRFLTGDEKNNMYLLFKKMMKSYREIEELLISNDENGQASFLNIFLPDWIKMRIELRKYLAKMKESWTHETTREEDVGYFG
jgi:hypothetical protein